MLIYSPTGVYRGKKLAAQKIWLVTFSFQGGDFIPLLAKLAHANTHTGDHHQHLGDWWGWQVLRWPQQIRPAAPSQFGICSNSARPGLGSWAASLGSRVAQPCTRTRLTAAAINAVFDIFRDLHVVIEHRSDHKFMYDFCILPVCLWQAADQSIYIIL